MVLASGAVVSLSLETCFHASPGAGRTIASGYSNARSNALIRECWPPLPPLFAPAVFLTEQAF